MGITDNFDDYYMAKPLKKLIKSGKADPAVLDEKIRNILRLMLRIKLIDIEVKKMAKDDRKSCSGKRQKER